MWHVFETQYGEAEYWDHRYQSEPVFFDWYLSYEGLEPVLQQHVPKDASILQVSTEAAGLEGVQYSPTTVNTPCAAALRADVEAVVQHCRKGLCSGPWLGHWVCWGFQTCHHLDATSASTISTAATALQTDQLFMRL